MSSVVNRQANLSAAALASAFQKSTAFRAITTASLRSRPLAYCLAIALPAGMLLMRFTFDSTMGDTPMLVLFLFPVIVCAYLGGLGPGVLATILGSLETNYFLMAPRHSFLMYGAGNCLNWTGFVAAGGLVSILSEALQRAHGRTEQSYRDQLSAREQLARIAATAPGIIHAFRLRPDGTSCFSYANPRIEEIYGIPLEELQRDASVIRKVLHPEDEPRLWASVLESKRTMSPWRAEFRVRHPKNGEMWVEAHSVPELEPDGSIQWHGFMQDVTARKKAEENLDAANRQLVEASRVAGMAEMATSVLHNVGNVLNSVNVAASLVADKVRQTKATHLNKAVALMQEHESDLATFLTRDPKGQKIVPYLRELALILDTERTQLLKELAALAGNVEHVMEIVSTQQNGAKSGGLRQVLDVTELVEDALRMDGPSLSRHNIEVMREYSKLPQITVEKNKVLQILVNVVRNAQQACEESGNAKKALKVRLMNGEGRVRIAVADNGVGIAPENLPKIFTRGFTTKKNGHGFGLHSSTLAAAELGGRLLVESEGLGKGATFTLELPVKPEPAGS